MKKITALSLSAATYLSLAVPAFAAPVQTPINPCPVLHNQGGLDFRFLCDLAPTSGIMGAIIALLFVIALIVAFAFLIFGGIKWIVSGGDKAKVEAARGTIVAALVGLVLVFLAFFIINFLVTAFGLGSIQNLRIPDLTPDSP